MGTVRQLKDGCKCDALTEADLAALQRQLSRSETVGVEPESA